MIKDYSKKKFNSGNNEELFFVSNGELSYGIIYLIIIIFELLMLIFLCISDLIRIKLGINGSYTHYIKMQYTQENTQKNSKADINTYPIYKKEEEKPYDKSTEKKENGMTPQLSDKLKNENKNI